MVALDVAEVLQQPSRRSFGSRRTASPG